MKLAPSYVRSLSLITIEHVLIQESREHQTVVNKMSKEKNDYWKKISDSLGEKDESMLYLYQCLFELGWDAAMTEICPLVKNLHTKRFIWNDPLSRHSPSVEKLRELTMSSDDALLERENRND